MAYSRKMGADHPGLIVFVLDQSGSMAANWPGGEAGQQFAKAEALADILNGAIREIGARSVKGNDISPRCDMAVVGYEGSTIASQWGGPLAGREILSIQEIIPAPLGEDEATIKMPDGRGGLVETQKKVKYWLEPKAGGGTPMGDAMRKARQIVEQWLQDPKHQASFPPIIIHVTDGMPNDEQAAKDEAAKIRALSTNDGAALVINIHVPESFGYPIAFPSSESDLPPNDRPARLLFDMSSELPSEMLESAQASQLPVKPGCKLMIANGNAVMVTQLIQWGSSGRLQDAPAAPAGVGVND